MATALPRVVAQVAGDVARRGADLEGFAYRMAERDEAGADAVTLGAHVTHQIAGFHQCLKVAMDAALGGAEAIGQFGHADAGLPLGDEFQDAQCEFDGLYFRAFASCLRRVLTAHRRPRPLRGGILHGCEKSWASKIQPFWLVKSWRGDSKPVERIRPAYGPRGTCIYRYVMIVNDWPADN